MSSPDRWREPRPGEWLVKMDRWTIESHDLAMYEDLCAWPNRYISDTESVIWIIPAPEWLLMVLRWPELEPWGQCHAGS